MLWSRISIGLVLIISLAIGLAFLRESLTLPQLIKKALQVFKDRNGRELVSETLQINILYIVLTKV